MCYMYGVSLQDFHTNRVNRENPMCSESTSLSVSLTTPLGYTLNEDKPGFGFKLEVYNYCHDPDSDGGDGGDGKSITFDEAIKHLDSKFYCKASRKHLRTNVTPDLHLRYSKNGGNLGSDQNDKK